MNQKLSKLDQMKALRQLAAERAERAKQKVASRESAVASQPPVKPPPPPTVRLPDYKPRVFRDMVRQPDQNAPSKPSWPGRLREIGLSVAEFGRLTKVPSSTIKDWSRGKSETPGWVASMVSLLEGDEENVRRLRSTADIEA